MKEIFGKGKVVDLCDFGSNVVIIYAEDFDTFDKYRKDARCLRADPYWKGMIFVGGDAYFDRKHKVSLKRQLKI